MESYIFDNNICIKFKIQFIGEIKEINKNIIQVWYHLILNYIK